MNQPTSYFHRIFEGSDHRGIIASIASISVVGMGIGLSFPLLSLLMEQRGIASSIIGANTAVAGIAAMIVVPFVTPLARRIGVVNTMLSAMLVFVMCMAGFYLTDNLPVWFVLRFIASACVTSAFILSEFWINSATVERNRGMILGIYGSVLSIGFAVGPGILSLVGTVGFLPFAIGIGIILSAMMPILYGRDNEPKMEKTGKTPSVLPYLFMVPLATMAGLVFGAAEQIELALLPVFAVKSSYEVQTAALFLTVVGLGNVLLQIPLGILSDRVNDRRTVLLGCTLVGLIGAILIPLLANISWMLAIILFVYGGIISGMYTVGLAHLGSRLSGTDLAQANAAFVLCYGFGMTLGPQIAGIAMDLIGPAGFGATLFMFFALYLAVYIFRYIQNK